MAEPSEHALAVVARMDGVVRLDLTVTDTSSLTPTLQALRLTGDLSGFAPLPGQDVMVSVYDASERHRWRRYTVRRCADSAIELWVTIDSEGPGARWARSARPGAEVEAVGPRGKVHVDEHAQGLCFVVDESGLAAACAMAESLAPGRRVHVATPHAADGSLVPTVAAGVMLSTSPLVGSARIDTDALADQLAGEMRAPDWPAFGATSAYVFGELGLTRDARGVLEALGVPETRIATKAYWRAGLPNEDHGEPGRS
jgi:NADPH-dependent ferric siderophore reductase